MLDIKGKNNKRHCAIMSGRLIALYKQPDVRPVGVEETWRHLFDKILLKVTGQGVTMSCQD